MEKSLLDAPIVFPLFVVVDIRSHCIEMIDNQ